MIQEVRITCKSRIVRPLKFKVDILIFFLVGVGGVLKTQKKVVVTSIDLNRKKTRPRGS